MADLVPAEKIEEIVGVKRHDEEHWGRAVSAEQTVYILHSRQCLESSSDLRDCAFSIAMDRGIQRSSWSDYEDRPVCLGIIAKRLVPRSVAPKEENP